MTKGAPKREVRQALMASRKAFALTGLFSFFINLLMLTAPLYMLQIYDRVLASRSISTLVALTVLAGGLLLVMAVLDLIRSRVFVRIGAKLDQRLNTRVFTAVFEQQLLVKGSARGQPLRDLDSLRQFLTGQGPFALFDSPWVPVYLAVIFLFHPVLGLIATAGAVLLFIIAVLNEVVTRRPLREANRQATLATGFAESSLRNAEVLEAMGMLGRLRGRWLAQHQQAMALQATASDRAGGLTALTKAIRLFLQVAILGAGAALAVEQIITPGVMIAASIIMGRALAPVEQAMGHWRGFVAARDAYGRLHQLLEALPARDQTMKLPAPLGLLQVEGVSALAPGGSLPVLKDVAFALKPGQALGVIGPTAAGKSTLARLLVGVWRPVRGAVRLDGVDVSSWPSEERGGHLGYLPQDVELFDGTIAENIARFAEPIDPEQVVRAANRAGVHELILHLGAGYETRIGESGSVLSGGQRQRIGLARALYGDPKLVVLDEPNSNLDAAGDAALTQAILALKDDDCTVVVMAHRPSAISAVDQLLVLRDGAVQAFGPKDEVLAKVTQVAGRPEAQRVASLQPATSEAS